MLFNPEGAKVEEDESKNQTDENSPKEKPSENIEIFDIEVDEAIEKWKKAKNQIPATPIFHGGESLQSFLRPLK